MAHIEFDTKTNEAITHLAAIFGKTEDWVIERAKTSYLIRGEGRHLLSGIMASEASERGELKDTTIEMLLLKAVAEGNEESASSMERFLSNMLRNDKSYQPVNLFEDGMKAWKSQIAVSDKFVRLIAQRCGKTEDEIIKRAVEWYALHDVGGFVLQPKTDYDVFRTAFTDDVEGRTILREFLLVLDDTEAVAQLDRGEAIDIEAKLADASRIVDGAQAIAIRKELQLALEDLYLPVASQGPLLPLGKRKIVAQSNSGQEPFLFPGSMNPKARVDWYKLYLADHGNPDVDEQPSFASFSTTTIKIMRFMAAVHRLPRSVLLMLVPKFLR